MMPNPTDDRQSRMRDDGVSRVDPRRSFLKWVAGLAGAAAATIATIPVLGALFFPVRVRTVLEGEGFIPVAAEAELPSDTPVKAAVRTARRDAWTEVKDVELAAVWVEKKKDGKVIAFSSICPHLGCSVDYLPDSNTFNCPCHGSVFTKDGEVVSGPSPRPLDRLETWVQNGQLLVKFERFVPGTKDRRRA